MKYLNKSFIFGFLALGAACGGDSDGGGGGGNVDTGLEESQPLSDVSAADFTEACNSIQATVEARFGEDRVTEFGCEIGAAFISEDAASCRDFRDDCIANPPEMGDEGMDLGSATDLGCGSPTGLEDCDVTVGEFESCLNESLDAIDAFIGQFTCANAGNIDLEQAQMDPLAEPPQSCARLRTECPEAGFGGEQPQ